MTGMRAGTSNERRPRAVPTWVTLREAVTLFFHGVTVRTASKVALLVGTVLSLVNQGSTIASGDATAATWVRVGVNYLVPFLVSSYGFLAARRRPAPDAVVTT